MNRGRNRGGYRGRRTNNRLIKYYIYYKKGYYASDYPSNPTDNKDSKNNKGKDNKGKEKRKAKA